MFRTNLAVHHHEHSIIYCITQFGTVGTMVQASLAVLKQLDSPARLYRLYCVCNTVYYAVFLMMDDWIRSKHVEQRKNCGINLIVRIVHLVDH